MSPEGIANVAPDAESAGEQPLFHAFDDIDAVAVELDAVLINGRRFFKAGSSAEALHLAACVDRVRERPAARRGAAIERMVADALDSGKAETARANFARRTRLLTRCCAALFAFVFIASPSLLIFAGPHRSWPWLLGGLVALTATVTVLYVRAHAEMFPRCRYDRWVHAVTMVLLPVGAIRAVDHLLRDVFCACSPPAVLPIVCGDADAEPSMRKYLFDIGKGRAIDAGEPPAPAVACVEWFRRTLVAASESALLRRGLAVLRPPVREADTLRAYCPRCHAQYGSAAVGRCSECPGVALVAF
jgi:hypothetical protein